jgi:gliding motility-associated lipoprotein GldH
MRLISIFLLFGSLTILLSCQDNVYYEKSYPIENGAWTYSDTLDFEFAIEDTSQLYQIWLNIEHTKTFPFQNLYVLIYSELPSGERFKERISLPLMDKKGMWYGKCGSKNCQLVINLQEKVKFEMAGNYRFTIEQNTRQNPIKGVNEIGFKVERFVQDNS